MASSVCGSRAGPRAYQKAENFPISGEVDAWTADGLGVRPEGHVETGNETTDKVNLRQA